jgi:hypothetical protein
MKPQPRSRLSGPPDFDYERVNGVRDEQRLFYFCFEFLGLPHDILV